MRHCNYSPQWMMIMDVVPEQKIINNSRQWKEPVAKEGKKTMKHWNVSSE